MENNFDFIEQKCFIIIKYHDIKLTMFKSMNNVLEAYQELKRFIEEEQNVDEILIIDYEQNRQLLNKIFQFHDFNNFNTNNIEYIEYKEELKTLRNQLENEDGIVYAYIKGNSGILKSQDIKIPVVLYHSIINDNVNKMKNEHYCLNTYDSELEAEQSYNNIVNDINKDFLYVVYFTITSKNINLYKLVKKYIDEAKKHNCNSYYITCSIFEDILKILYLDNNINKKRSTISRC